MTKNKVPNSECLRMRAYWEQCTYIAVLILELELESAFITNYEIRCCVSHRAFQVLCFKYAFPFLVRVRWISRDGPQHWTPRSPDLKSTPHPTPPHLYLWLNMEDTFLRRILDTEARVKGNPN
jgi:hypothetical protein